MNPARDARYLLTERKGFANASVRGMATPGHHCHGIRKTDHLYLVLGNDRVEEGLSCDPMMGDGF